MSSLGLGRNQLNSREQKAYDLLEANLLAHRSSINVLGVQGVNLPEILEIVVGDNPNLIYFDKSRIVTAGGLLVKAGMTLTGVISGAREQQRERELQKAIEDAAFEIDSKAHNDREILQGIHEYLQRTCTYCYEAASRMNDRRMMDAHNAYGALINHTAVCDGISSAYACIAQELGFHCMEVPGKSKHAGFGEAGHMWVIVQYGSDCYHLDPTWDLSGYSVIKAYDYSYFGLTDNMIALDHKWNFKRTPICNKSELNYYHHNHFIANSESDIRTITTRVIRSGGDIIHIQAGDNLVLGNDPGNFISERINEAAIRFYGSVRSEYSWNAEQRTAIIRLHH